MIRLKKGYAITSSSGYQYETFRANKEDDF